MNTAKNWLVGIIVLAVSGFFALTQGLVRDTTDRSANCFAKVTLVDGVGKYLVRCGQTKVQPGMRVIVPTPPFGNRVGEVTEVVTHRDYSGPIGTIIGPA